MSFIQNISISKKIPLLIIAATLLCGGLTAAQGIWNSRDSIKQANAEKLFALAHAKESSVTNYFQSVEKDLLTLATNQQTVTALEEFSLAWTEMGGTQTQTLQSLYITNNPNPAGEKRKLGFASDGSFYSQIHKYHHSWFRQLLEARQYNDIFLFDMNGNIVYSVGKDLDFATNVNSGPWKDSDLANAYRDAVAMNDVGAFSFYDFKPYEPSAAPAGFIAAPVFKNGQKIGVLAFQMPISPINLIMNESEGLGKTGEAFMVGEDLLILNQSRLSTEDTMLSVKADSEAVRQAMSGKDGTYVGKNQQDIETLSAYNYTDFGGKRFAIITEEAMSEVMAPVNNLAAGMIFGALILSILISAIGIALSHGITRPLVRITRTIQSLAAGDNNLDVQDVERGDEIGELAQAALLFKKSLTAQSKLGKQQVERDSQAKIDRKNAMLQLADSFERHVQSIVESVAKASAKLTQTTELLTKDMSESSHSSQNASSIVSETTSNVQKAATALEQMTHSVKEIASKIAQSNALVDDTANRGNQAMELAKALTHSADKIKNVVELVSGIASQTGLLALNATIESARAGEAGKGFAVVADEVKILSEQTSQSVVEVRQAVEEMLAVTGQITGAINSVTSSVKEVTQNATVIANAVEEQSATASEISRNMQLVSSTTDNINNNISEVSSTSERAASSSLEMLSVASSLSKQAETLDEQLKTFLQEVRAA